jgi:hypothetical protein
MEPKKRGRPKKIATQTDESVFSIRLQIGKNVYENTGSTMLEAINGLDVPEKMVLKGILDIAHGYKKKNILLTPMRMRQLFNPSPSFRAVTAKQLQTIIT